ncbi:DnaJ domain-containing protein [Alkaliphilus sp. MSJ-5]|uniref:DnaJ domain-containing protein n=1 Tax=Alkaliphilus flagellatus TaxID=2841507 RepID=A0ABS6G5S5_9FIRM|nr:DnaJ domain-containing protein [Alkaliphilus flagellatus]MBU5677843.1 DnaJ domain-containing protein [Alkaliphilus flagellatus]
MKNLYKILEISENASQAEIKKAYRGLAKKYHPDANINGENTEEKFKEITEAYSLLRDEKYRKEYDEKLFNSKNSEQKTFRREKSSSKKTSTDKVNVDYEFENFFGFNPKTKEKNKSFNKKSNKNPMDTTDIFNTFFKSKRH